MCVPTTTLHGAAWTCADMVLMIESLLQAGGGEAALQQVSSARVWTNAPSLPNSPHTAKEEGSGLVGLQIYNSHTPSHLLPWLPQEHCTKPPAVLCGKGLFLSAHKGCRRSFLAAPAPGELSQSSALLTDFRCPMWNRLGRAPRKGQKWGFASPARQGERGGEEVSSLPPANSFSHGK